MYPGVGTFVLIRPTQTFYERIKITKTSTPRYISKGVKLTYTIRVTNDVGPSQAHNVTVTDTLPASVDLFSFNTTQGSCSETSGTVTCNLGTVFKRTTVTITIVVITTVPGAIVNTVTVSGDETDPDASNDTASSTADVLDAPAVKLLKDIYPGFSGSSLDHLTAVGDTLFFEARTPSEGYELWKSDGTTAGTVMVKDIYPLFSSSNIDELTPVNGTLFFLANDGTNGEELWKSDGTASGTVMVKDIGAGSSSALAEELTDVGGTLFFKAYEPSVGYELWKSDGTASGTAMVKDIEAGASSASPQYLVNVGGILFFGAFQSGIGTELWKSDGTATGTVVVKDIIPGGSSGDPFDSAAVGGTLFFKAYTSAEGRELWKSDGTATGTVLVKDINPGGSFSIITGITDVGGTAFFSAFDGVNGRELWKSDGTASGTVMVKDIRPGNADSAPTQITDVAGTAFFVATDGSGDTELWKSDGTASGTVRVADIRPGPSASVPDHLTNANGTLYFSASDGTNGEELWRSGGYVSNTVMVKDIRPGGNSSFPANLEPMFHPDTGLTFLFFGANNGSTGNELFAALLNPNPNADLSVTKVDSPDPVFRDDPLTYTVGVTNKGPGPATDVTLTDELPVGTTFDSVTSTQGSCSQSGGTVTCDVGVLSVGAMATATILVYTPNSTGTISNSASVAGNEADAVPANNTTTIDTQVVDPPAEADLAISKTVAPGYVAKGLKVTYTITVTNDLGPSEGTNVTATDVLPPGVEFNSVSASQGSCSQSGGTVTCSLGTVLKRTSPTVTITAIAREAGAITNTASVSAAETDLNSTNNSSTVQSQSVIGPAVALIKDVRLGFSSSNPDDFVDVGGVLFFTANDGFNGAELWKSDGTPQGTVLEDISVGGQSSPDYLTRVDGTLFFTASHPDYGVELWKSDGTAAGTMLVRDIKPGAVGSFPTNLANASGTLIPS